MLGDDIMTKMTDVCNLNHKQQKKDDICIGTTPEFFAQLLMDEENVCKAIEYLENLGVKVKTEYGNFRPTYDVLCDFGKLLED